MHCSRMCATSTVPRRRTRLRQRYSRNDRGPIDVALFARERGLHVIAVPALAMARETPSRHPSGKKLHEVADLVPDNGGISGDARMALPYFSQAKHRWGAEHNQTLAAKYRVRLSRPI